MTGPLAAAATPIDRLLQRSVAALVLAQVLVVGLQVAGRLVFHRPFPWTEEIARLLLVWLMCAGGVVALRGAQHPRVTALVRRPVRHRLLPQRAHLFRQGVAATGARIVL